MDEKSPFLSIFPQILLFIFMLDTSSLLDVFHHLLNQAVLGHPTGNFLWVFI
jgi:hypothetical protein